MTLEKFFEVLDKLPREDYIVRMAAWYDHDPKPHQGELFNEILEYDGNEDQYVWLNDWYEGQQNINVIGFVAVSDINVPCFEEEEQYDRK